MKFWQHKGTLAFLLYPFSLLFALIVFCRKKAYQYFLPTFKADLPVIIIGNISVGGSGKTPLVIALALFLKSKGFKPVIVSRGYKSDAPFYPYLVNPHSLATESGDEPLLIAQRTNCPVIIDANRKRACQLASEKKLGDIILCDDGLQHYALQRDIEIAVVNKETGFGNGWLLPAGCLREPLSRLKEVDMVIGQSNTEKSDHFTMQLQIEGAVSLLNRQNILDLTQFSGQEVHAITGIAYPERFFNLLKSHGIKILPKAYSDHHAFASQDLDFNDNKLIFLTEKDAVKCQKWATDKMYFVKVSAIVEETCLENLLEKIYELKKTI